MAEQNEQGRRVVGDKIREAVRGIAHICPGKQNLEHCSR